MSEGNKTYYEIMGNISPTATTEEIQTRYRELVIRPENNMFQGTDAAKKAAQANMITINKAYETLRKPEARVAYDKSLLEPARATASGPTPAASMPGFTESDLSGIADFVLLLAEHSRFFQSLSRSPVPPKEQIMAALNPLKDKKACNFNYLAGRKISVSFTKAADGKVEPKNNGYNVGSKDGKSFEEVSQIYKQRYGKPLTSPSPNF